MCEYLKVRVKKWVIENRDDAQEPMLLPKDAPDVPLVHCCTNQPTQFPKSGARDDRWGQMADLWQTHDRLYRSPRKPYREKPLEWEAYQQNLLRADQLLEAGEAYDAEFKKAVSDANDAADKLKPPPPSSELEVYSLASAEQRGRLPSKQELEKLLLPPPGGAPGAPGDVAPPKPPATAEKTASAPAGAPAAGAAKEPAKEPAAAKPPAPAPRPDYLPAAAAAWNKALTNHEKADLKKLLDFVSNAKGQPGVAGVPLKADVVEVQFLRMLDRYLDSEVWRTRPELVGRGLAARQLAEQVMASPDLVAQYWIHDFVAAADNDRRLAEDWLYVGSPDALDQAKTLWESAAGADGSGGTYGKAKKLAETVSKALDARDWAWTEAPYLAQCLLARLAVGNPDAAELQSLHDLLDNLRELDRLLQDTKTWPANLSAEGQTAGRAGAEAAEKWQDDLAKATASLNFSMYRLSHLWSDEAGAFRDAASDAHTLRRIATLLALPLVNGDDRKTLRDKYLRIMFAEQKLPEDQNLETGKKTTSESAASEDWHARLDRWEKIDAHAEHPALALLKLGALDPPANSRENLARQGETARQLLRELSDKTRNLVQDSRDVLAKSSQQSAATVRQGCCNAERRLRASAALYAGRAALDPDYDPIAELRRFDLHEMLLWQARRTLDDFWGPKPGGDKSYFEIVANAYLADAAAVEGHALGWPAAGLSATVALHEDLDKLKTAAKKAVQPRVDQENPPVDSQGAGLVQSMEFDVSSGLPNGEAAAYLEYSSGTLAADLEARSLDNDKIWRRTAVHVPPIETPRLAKYRIEKNWDQDSHGRAVAFYRGHVRSVDFFPIRPGGVEIVYVPQPPRPAKIHVFDEARQRTRFMFIFDCSGSMGEPISKTDTRSKISVARGALCDVLNALAANEGACQAGVIAYGHRVWENNGFYTEFKKGELLTHDPVTKKLVPANNIQPPAAALALSQIDPDTDIEVFNNLPGGAIAPLTEKRVEAIKRRLYTLDPTGMTPLYRSIRIAIDELNRDDDMNKDSEPVQKQIVVLTDGANEQHHVQDTCEQLRAVLDLPQNRHTRVGMVGFQIDTLTAEEKAAYEEMKRVLDDPARGRRVEFFDAPNPKHLLLALRKLVGDRRYEVRRKESTTPVCEPLELKKTFDFLPRTPEWFTVRLFDASQLEPSYDSTLHAPTDTAPTLAEALVRLEGGEGLELYYRGEAGKLVHKRFDHDPDLPVRGLPQRIADPADAEHTCWIAAHLPKRRENDDVEFYVSVQNDKEELFSRRPVEAWIEIAPQYLGGLAPPADASAPRKYVFVNKSFADDKPVPVLQCVVPRWPKQCDYAQITLWCKFDETKPDPVPLRDLKTYRNSDAPDVSFDYEIERGQPKIVINERHHGDADIYRLKLKLSPAQGRSRRFAGGSIPTPGWSATSSIWTATRPTTWRTSNSSSPRGRA